MHNDAKQALIVYGRHKLQEMTKGDQAELPDKDTWESYESILRGGQKREPEKVLTCIFSLIKTDAAAVESRFYSAQPLALQHDTLFPNVQPEAQRPGPKLWDQFTGEVLAIPEADPDARFETFYHLYHKYAWAVPCTYGEPGVSLFEQWKAVAALVFATGQDWRNGPAGKFTLIGGDIPGIQDFVYTITSKGAAKGLRGRSFFLQLLGDAVVRRLLADLGLCSGNVIYNAGGNFMLLGPTGSMATLPEWQTTFNRVLLDEFEGDLYLALAWEDLPSSAVGTSAFVDVREQLGTKIAAAKNRRFAEVVDKDGWAALFQTQGQGGLEYCQVCHREPQPGEELVEEVTEAGETVRTCVQCLGFEDLARAIAHDPLWMIVAKADKAAQRDKGWQGTLARLTDFAYRFTDDQPKVTGPGTIYVLNDTDLEPAHGFRFVANVTPRIGKEDRQWVQEHHPDLEVPTSEYIKDFELMALQAQGIPRVGVLRMDVDNLGSIFGEYLRGSMAQVSALSAALSLFFGGYLNRLCDEVNAQGEHNNVLYVIYAGGDDLFVVGAWDRMPLLAERIQADFATYTGNNRHLTISGGVTLEDRKFPLYRAAERAGEAEGQAKGYTRPDSRRKDALCFLGTVVGWEDWALVRQQKEEILWLIGEDKANKAKKEEERAKRLPRALLQVMQNIHQLYASGLQAVRRRVRRDNRQRPADKKLPLPNPRLFFGRWAWMHVYSLTRLARQHEKRVPEAPERIKELQNKIMQPATVRYSGLAARWAEYLTRKEVSS